ncbi:MAG: hypothetical protein M3370_10260 [Actinomycetota bacterium]|nr:hypothetical protein [Actinomycetota bacterium]
MGHVVDLARAGGHIAAKHGAHGLADGMRDRLAVGPGEVGGGGHRGQVGAAVIRRGRGAGELAVGQLDAVGGQRGVHALDEVGADLVAQSARARMDQHGDLVGVQVEAGLVQASHVLDLDEVVARPHGPQLRRPALTRAVRDALRVGAIDASLGLGVLEVVLRADPVLLDQRTGTLHEHPLELGGGEVERATLTGAGGHAPGDLVHELLLAPAQLGEGHRQGRFSARRLYGCPYGRPDHVAKVLRPQIDTGGTTPDLTAEPSCPYGLGQAVRGRPARRATDRGGQQRGGGRVAPEPSRFQSVHVRPAGGTPAPSSSTPKSRATVSSSAEWPGCSSA